MMFRFVGAQYLKYFFIIFLALEGFFLAIDTLKYIDDLPDSANLLILFLFYDGIYALTYTLPISLVLCSIICYMALLKSVQFTALMALGYSKLQILFPLLIISSIFTAGFIGLNSTSFAYAQEYAEGIIYQNTQNVRENLLLKSGNQYIFLRKLYPLSNGEARAEGIKIFVLDNEHRLIGYHESKEAFFESNTWILKNAKSVSISPTLTLGDNPLQMSVSEELETLQGFSSKVLETIAQDKPIASLIDALASLHIAHKQGVSTDKIRAILYGLLIVPFFVPLCIAIIAYYIPSLPRYGNLTLISFVCIIGALAIWGLFFSLSQLSVAGLIYPELGLLLPMGILFVIFLWHIRHLNKKFS
ncbi:MULTISPECIES: LptF/LptG family permease [Helicobacter]|uniref:Permease YjgP/YjgQ n=1 Tax=Helicobacter typhlonius TaxID=76936 RepID=A0A099UCS0_9HELI|nr:MULTISPECIES: LptF/LptG family permease [Helicobacter]TLD79197.1 YjgP/YjgQ family permease [Helicobacter typhlonius]TLD86117.1 YjgP/YjgQ family permease [Helicobacter sp. MIT 03-1616]CUU40536.1 Permease YjgP/YjgQ [Helicobacter typhlonius]HCD72601.1 YjgP/YjgQ family permease [Helicobacter sp.]